MLNVVALLGRLVADPELRRTPNGVSVTTFTIAVDRSFVKAGAERQTDFIDIVAWRNTAEFVCKYFQKGSMMAVQGSIQTRSYEDKEGKKRKAFEIMADNVFFGGSKNSQSAPSGSYAAASPSSVPDYTTAPAPAMPAFSQGSADDFAVVDDNEDLPF
ncbi:MAG: single-stranded DNA-binding protein [Pygmaiobacter sp.]